MAENAGIDRKGLGENLRRLRQMRNLSQQSVAAMADVSILTYRNIETGKSTPKLETLQVISKALESSVTALLRPVRIPKAVRFRAKKNLRTRNVVLSEVTKWLENYSELEALVEQEAANSHIRDVREKIADQTNAVRVKCAAEYIREYWGLRQDEPIRNISGLFDKHGVKVLSIPKGSNDFFGLSIGEEDRGPAVAVNTWERISVERWIFSAAHELGHLILHSEAFDVDKTEEIAQEEREADLFASNFMMPQEAFENERSALRGMHWVDMILTLKRIFKVSWKTVMMRLIDNGICDSSAWREFHIHYQRRYGVSLKGHREPSPLSANEFASAFTSEEPETLRKTDFPNNQLESLLSLALDQGKITMSKAAEIMGVSVNKMRQVTAEWNISPNI